jgi:hypothetical protein
MLDAAALKERKRSKCTDARLLTSAVTPFCDFVLLLPRDKQTMRATNQAVFSLRACCCTARAN